jgi:hypothetical protein
LKKYLTLMVAGLLALVLAVPAFAAAKPIDVYINGSKLSFTAGSPYLQNNSVLVPFRVVFEKLGLKVLWDAKTGTVTGTGPNLSVSLKIGSKLATVNGTVKKLPLAPVSSGGTTYIPLRFIAEATGGTAEWNPTTQTVQIKTSTSNPTADAVAITELIKLMNTYFNQKNASGYVSLLAPDSIYEDTLSNVKNAFDTYDQSITLDDLEIIDLKADEATTYTTETNRRKAGFYFPDQRYEYLYTLVRINGKWKVSEVENQGSTVLLTREQGLKTIDVPQADSGAIQDTIKKYYQFMNAKDVTNVVTTMTSGGAESDETLKADFEDFFDSYDMTYTLGVSNIFYYSAIEAAIYVETKEKEASERVSFQTGEIYVLSKSDKGVWTIDTTYTVSSKQL